MLAKVRDLYQGKSGGYKRKYIVDWDDIEGRRHRKGFLKKKEAESYRRELIVSLSQGDLLTAKRVTVQELMILHRKEVPTSKVMEVEQRFMFFMERFKKWDINEVNRKELMKWFDDLKAESDLTNKSLNKTRSHLNHFFRWLIDEEVISVNPMLLVRRFPEHDEEIRFPPTYYSTDEVADFLRKVKEFDPLRLYPLYFCLVETGVRRKMALDLKWVDIDFILGAIRFTATKVHKSLYVEMSDALKSLLSSLPRMNEYVFTNHRGQRLSKNTVSYLQIKFNRVYPSLKRTLAKSLRTSYVTNSILDGSDPLAVSRTVGHSRLDTTMKHYILKTKGLKRPSPYDWDIDKVALNSDQGDSISPPKGT